MVLSNTDAGAVNVDIIVGGKSAVDQNKLISLEVDKQANKVPTARIEFLDGEVDKQDFPLSNESVLEPGAEIEIVAGHGPKKGDTIFKGIVVRIGVRADSNAESNFIVECSDAAVRMTVGRKSENYIDKKDSEIINSLIASYKGLTHTVESTDITYKEQVQFYCTDWDFMLMRAEANACVVLVDDGSIDVKKPDLKSGKKLEVEYGVDLISIELNTNAATQLTGVKTRSWDPKSQAVLEQVTRASKINEIGNLPANELAKVVDLDEFQMQTPTSMELNEHKTWGEAQQVKSDFARVSGSLTVRGNATAKLGGVVELEGVGNRFSGKSFITGVIHTIEDGGWTTELKIGMEETWIAERVPVSSVAAGGAVASIPGLQIGKVLKLDEDPAGEHRIQVSLPTNSASKPGIWARFASFYASNSDESSGAFFVPEVGDEVVLGFLDGHPAHPIILGSLYSSKHNPYQELTAENNIKGIVSRSKIKIEFDDEKKILTVITPGENSIVISDEEKSIVMEDQTGNKVSMSEEGISLDSPKDIALKAKGKISMNADGEISVKSKADVSVNGNNIKNDAKMGFTGSGSSQAVLESSGQTTVKGSMVMIN